MNCCSIEDLCRKDVINIENAARVGTVCDVEVDVCDGKIVSLIILSQCRTGSFKRGDTLKVCWSDIEVIGEDTILVKNVCPVAQKKSSKPLFDIFSK